MFVGLDFGLCGVVSLGLGGYGYPLQCGVLGYEFLVFIVFNFLVKVLVFGGLSYWDLELWKRRRGLRLDVVWDSRVLGRVEWGKRRES